MDMNVKLYMLLLQASAHSTYWTVNLIGPYRTYSSRLWSRVLPEKLIDTQTVNKYPACYGTRMFITVYAKIQQNFYEQNFLR